MKEYFDEKASEKRIFFFVDDDRASLNDAEIDSEISIHVKNEWDESITIPFRVTRNTYLGKKMQWIYGMILNASDGEYYQIELKLHKGEPKMDTIEMFLQAPPVIFNELR